jgi:Fe-S cluster biosynthesis and repair protein YggX
MGGPDEETSSAVSNQGVCRNQAKEYSHMATITCVRCGQSREQLDSPPTGGQLGEKIRAKVCPDCYNEWVSQQVLYINHYGLQMADPDDRKRLIQAMKEFLNLEA